MNVYRFSFIFIVLMVLSSCDKQSSSPVEMRTLTQKALIKNMTGNDVTITLSQELCLDEEQPELSYTALVKSDSSLVVAYVDLVYPVSVEIESDYYVNISKLMDVMPRYIAIEYQDGAREEYNFVYNSGGGSPSNPTNLNCYHKLDSEESSDVVLFQYNLVSWTFSE